jgi:hypothetical protein
LRGGFEDYAGGADGYPVVVDDGDCRGGSGLRRSGADQDERKEESTHAVAGVFYGGMRTAQRRVFQREPKFIAVREARAGSVERKRPASLRITAKA